MTIFVSVLYIHVKKYTSGSSILIMLQSRTVFCLKAIFLDNIFGSTIRDWSLFSRGGVL